MHFLDTMETLLLLFALSYKIFMLFDADAPMKKKNTKINFIGVWVQKDHFIYFDNNHLQLKNN